MSIITPQKDPTDHSDREPLVATGLERDCPDWDVIAARYGTVFHSSKWVELLEESFEINIRRIGFMRDKKIVGILPLSIKRYVPIRVGASPLIPETSPVQGIACDPADINSAIRTIGEYSRENGLHFLRLFQKESFTDHEHVSGFDYVEKHTHVLDLTITQTALWEGLEGRCRTAVRKAEKSGIEVVEEKDNSNLEGFHNIFARLYQDQGMSPPVGSKFFHCLWEKYSSNGLHFILARLDQKIIAGALLLQSEGRANYLIGASLPEYNNLNPNNLVQWTGIRLAKSNGAKEYDFVGSDIERLAKFKKSFGGRLENYTLLERSSSLLVKQIRTRIPEIKAFLRDVKSFGR